MGVNLLWHSEQVLQAARRIQKDYPGINFAEALEIVKIGVEHAKADAAEVRHGKWKKIQNYALCSNCKHEVNWGCKDFLSPYCPNCGTKMDKE